MPTKIEKQLTSDQFQIDKSGNLVINEIPDPIKVGGPPPELGLRATITISG